MSKPDICIVGMHFWPETTGNAPYTVALAESLAQAGLGVEVITGIPHYPEWVPRAEYRRGLIWRERLVGCSVTRVRHAVPRKPDLTGRARLESSFLCEAMPLVFRSKAKAVVAVSPTLSGLAAGVMGSRTRPLGVLVQDLNGTGASESGLASSSIAARINSLELALMKRASLIGVIAPRFGEVLVAGGVREHSLRNLPNFTHVSPVDCSKEESRRRLGLPTDQVLAVHTGNIGHKQGLDVVLEAAKSQPAGAVRYVLVGDGNQRTRLQEKSRSCPEVVFLPPVSGEDYPHVLNAADVLLLTEKIGVREMSLPSKLTSYAIAGRPIIASVDPGGIAANLLAKHNAAKLARQGDGQALHSSVLEVLGEASMVESLVAGASSLASAIGGRAQAFGRYQNFALELLDHSRGFQGARPHAARTHLK